MKFKERKKDLLEKLDYLGYSKKNKKKALRYNYGIFGRIKKNYINFERDVKEASEILRYYENKREHSKGELEKALRKVKKERLIFLEQHFKREGQSTN